MEPQPPRAHVPSSCPFPSVWLSHVPMAPGSLFTLVPGPLPGPSARASAGTLCRDPLPGPSARASAGTLCRDPLPGPSATALTVLPAWGPWLLPPPWGQPCRLLLSWPPCSICLGAAAQSPSLLSSHPSHLPPLHRGSRSTRAPGPELATFRGTLRVSH